MMLHVSFLQDAIVHKSIVGHAIAVGTVAERLEIINYLNIKPRRTLKGHQAKVLCSDWSPDKRHIVSSSQVGVLLDLGKRTIFLCFIKRLKMFISMLVKVFLLILVFKCFY